MRDQLISVKTAKLAKEKGFNEETSHYYDLLDNKLKHTIEGFSNPNEDCMVDIELEWHNYSGFNRLAASTQSLLQKWLREKHNLHAHATLSLNNGFWNACVEYVNKPAGMDMTDTLFYDDIDHKTYEDATEIAEQQALKLIP